jgi:hypothetical protein
VLEGLRPVFEHLSALGVATLSVPGGPAPRGGWFQTLAFDEANGVAALRHAAREHGIGLAEPGYATVALHAAGLPVLPIPPGLASGDPEQAATAQATLLRDIAELAADMSRRQALTLAGRRAAQEAIQEGTDGRSLDAALAERLRGSTPSQTALRASAEMAKEGFGMPV